jgi:hypothetical protein
MLSKTQRRPIKSYVATRRLVMRRNANERNCLTFGCFSSNMAATRMFDSFTVRCFRLQTAATRVYNCFVFPCLLLQNAATEMKLFAGFVLRGRDNSEPVRILRYMRLSKSVSCSAKGRPCKTDGNDRADGKPGSLKSTDENQRQAMCHLQYFFAVLQVCHRTVSNKKPGTNHT